jgi:hypothetical protein
VLARNPTLHQDMFRLVTVLTTVLATVQGTSSTAPLYSDEFIDAMVNSAQEYLLTQQASGW